MENQAALITERLEEMGRRNSMFATEDFAGKVKQKEAAARDLGPMLSIAQPDAK